MHRRFEKVSSANGASDENSEPISYDDDESEQEEQENGIQQEGNGKLSYREFIAISKTGNCALCGKTSVCICERCGDFYCSPQCQRKDWPNHRYICFPMPRLIKSGKQCNAKEILPVLKAEAKPVELSKEESRQAYAARQLSFIPTPSALPKDGSCVVLTGFKSANRCYIRSADPTVTVEYLKIIRKIDYFGRHSNDVNGVPKINSFAIAQLNEKWGRVQILSARSDNRIRVHFIDYGVISVRYLRDLRRISGAMSNLPSYVNMVQLHNVTVYSMEAKFIQRISENCDKEFKMHIVDSDEVGGNVELYHMDTNKLLNTEILRMVQECQEKKNDPPSNENEVEVSKEIAAEVQSPLQKTQNAVHSNTNGTPEKKTDDKLVIESSGKNDVDISPSSSAQKKKNTPTAPRQIKKPCMVPPFETIPFNVDTKDVKVLVVDNTYVASGYLGCLLEKDSNKLQAVQKFLQNYDGSGQAYKPKLEEYCIAQFESEWYRARVVEILDEDKFLVAYIDFTNECELTSASIRRYPMSLTLPCCTNLCAVDGLPDTLSEELTAFLEKELSGFTKINVDRIKILDEVTIIECKELLKKLHDLKFI